MDKTEFRVIFLDEYKLGKIASETSMNHLVKDLFLFAQHIAGSIGFYMVAKGLMTLSIQEGSDPSMTNL